MTTTTTTTTDLIAAVIAGDTTGYVAASATDKRAVRNGLADAVRAAVAAGDIVAAQAAMAAEAAIKVARPSTAPADNTARVIARVTDLLGAAMIVAETDDESVDSARVADAVIAWLDAPATPTDRARKIAAEVSVTRAGKSTDVGAHLRQVAAQHPSGTFLSVAQVAHTTTDECPDGYPHQGAIAARLFPTSGECTVREVIAAPATSDRVRGMIVR